VQRHLGLPAEVLSGSLLPWDGVADVVELDRRHRTVSKQVRERNTLF
jgi:hypothetical protein